MSDLPSLDIGALDTIEIKGRRDRIVARFAVGAMLYFPWTGHPDQAQAIGRAAESVLELLRPRIRWISPQGDDFFPAAEIGPTLQITRAFAEAGRRQASFLAHDGERKDDAGANSLAVHVPRVVPSGKLGFLGFTMGFAHLHSLPPDTLRTTLVRLAEALQPAHGTCGLCLALCPNPYAAREADIPAVPFLERYPGLAFDHPIADAMQLRDGFKCVNWITILGDALVERLGGADHLSGLVEKNGLDAQCYRGGMIVQAGGAPELGDVQQNLFPEAYRRAGKVLKPARAPFDDVIFDADMGSFDAAGFSRSWLARFDG